ncbi:hypothetical protein CHS0354_003735 [Potamilus streckersoni]|uniref:Uncharacterized protein n=1 Tax=Potamilus streckersoni TaxID=2493646 RepID=A0AAE0VZK1_9BIVA|nr:hypothetical protein CHS0354_003735 [Potamilus streckersoni]
MIETGEKVLSNRKGHKEEWIYQPAWNDVEEGKRLRIAFLEERYRRNKLFPKSTLAKIEKHIKRQRDRSRRLCTWSHKATRLATIYPLITDLIPVAEKDLAINLDDITETKVRGTIKALKHGKAYIHKYWSGDTETPTIRQLLEQTIE